MSKSKAFNTVCPCGETLEFEIAKPTILIRTMTRVQCAKCKSKFLIACEQIKRKWPRQYKCEFEVTHLSEKAQEIVSLKLKEKEATK